MAASRGICGLQGEAESARQQVVELRERDGLIERLRDGLRAENEAFAPAVVAAGGSAPTNVHRHTEHPYRDRRIARYDTRAEIAGSPPHRPLTSLPRERT